MRRYKVALTIGGSDSGGAAGIQADLKTFFALGCYGVSAITILTAQNTLGVQYVNKISANFVRKQLQSVFTDIKVDAIKTGFLPSEEITSVVAKEVAGYKKLSFIVDPVMVNKYKKPLLSKKAKDAAIKKLFPIATLVTPNLGEVEYLLGTKISSLNDMEQAAIGISKMGAQAVLVKGGHLEKMKDSIDCLYLKKSKQFYFFSSPRIKTKNTHGTGCTLSAAITGYLALGCELITAVTNAKQYISAAILGGSNYRLGSGPGPVKPKSRS
jgi:hydroxymethylpyrimidine/phosphomethylpyrimidine kinase